MYLWTNTILFFVFVDSNRYVICIDILCLFKYLFFLQKIPSKSCALIVDMVWCQGFYTGHFSGHKPHEATI